MKNLKNYHFAIIAIALLWSCQKEDKKISGERNEVQFFACYNESLHTKATKSFTVGNKATIYACNEGSAPTSSAFLNGTPLEATAISGGVLDPIKSLFVPKGSYDFYSVSQNDNNSHGLTFIEGDSEQLTNGKDYLWSKAGPVQESEVVNFIYSHKAVGIEIAIYGGEGISSLDVTSIKFTPSKPGHSTKLSLETGIIGKATQIESLTSLYVYGNKGSTIMLPLTSNSIEIEITANLTIGEDQVVGKKYSAILPAMEYKGGTFYTLNLTVLAASISFSGALLEDWETQIVDVETLTEQ